VVDQRIGIVRDALALHEGEQLAQYEWYVQHALQCVGEAGAEHKEVHLNPHRR